MGRVNVDTPQRGAYVRLWARRETGKGPFWLFLLISQGLSVPGRVKESPNYHFIEFPKFIYLPYKKRNHFLIHCPGPCSLPFLVIVLSPFSLNSKNSQNSYSMPCVLCNYLTRDVSCLFEMGFVPIHISVAARVCAWLWDYMSIFMFVVWVSY